jgi:very-short-patch-repair endonuclease
MKRTTRTPLTAIARALRTASTDAERRLWYHLRGRRLEGLKFRRQLAIGPYVADFACIERGLVIELDGGQHADRVAADAERTRFLNGQGFRVVRFWNDEVLRETDAVLEAIVGALRQRPSP